MIKTALALLLASCTPEPEGPAPSPFDGAPPIRIAQQRPVSEQPMKTATRTKGVAPLAVVFDPIDEASGVVQPDHEKKQQAQFAYLWNFGDDDSGTWKHNGKSKNQSLAWIGAHVFEQPGKYRVTLQVIDHNGDRHAYHQTIEVTDQDKLLRKRTFYVAADGKDSNRGSKNRPFLTAAKGLREALAARKPARLLFRRGDAFTCDTNWSIGDRKDKLVIGAYGDGDRPKIDFTGDSVGIDLSASNDVCLDSLDITSTSTTQPKWANGCSLGNRSLLKNCRFGGFASNCYLGSANEVVVYGCELVDSVDYGMYAFGKTDAGCLHMAVIGNLFERTGQHLLRTYTSKSVIQSNFFGEAKVTAMKLCGRPPPDPSHHVCVMDNHVQTEVISDMVGIGPENGDENQHAIDYQVEGNRFVSREEGNNCIQLRGRDLVVRNNVFDVLHRRAIRIERWGVEPEPGGIVIENNTVYSVSRNDVKLIWAKTFDDTVVRNNIMYCPGGKAETPIGTVVEDRNMTRKPGFTDAENGDFTLKRGGKAVDAGRDCYVRFDFFGRPRPAGRRTDAGAFERQ